jgi:hypothetical protein
MPRYHLLLEECCFLYGKFQSQSAMTSSGGSLGGEPDFTLYVTDELEMPSGKVVPFCSCSEC